MQTIAIETIGFQQSEEPKERKTLSVSSGVPEIPHIEITPGVEIFLHDHCNEIIFRGTFNGGHYYQLSYCHEGVYESHLPSGRVIRLAAKEMEVCTDVKTCVHSVMPAGYYKGYNILFRPEKYTPETRRLFECFSINAEQTFEQLLDNRIFCRFTCNPHMTGIFEDMYTDLCRDELLHVKLNLLHILVEIQHYNGVVERQYRYFSRQGERKINEVKKYLETHACSPLNMHETAMKYGFSESSLGRYFKSFYGCTPGEYLRRYRMKAAEKLLLETDLSVSEIGMRVAYENPSKFSAAFCSFYGLTPREYRKNRQVTDTKNSL